MGELKGRSLASKNHCEIGKIITSFSVSVRFSPVLWEIANLSLLGNLIIGSVFSVYTGFFFFLKRSFTKYCAIKSPLHEVANGDRIYSASAPFPAVPMVKCCHFFFFFFVTRSPETL